MDSAPSQTAPCWQRHRWLRLSAIGLLALALGGAIGFWNWRAQVQRQLGDLERQLLLAQRMGDAGAVGEIARRIVRLSDSPARLLAVSEILVQARRFDDLETTLAEVRRLAPERANDVLRLRAKAAAARPDLAAGIALWHEYLAAPAVAAADRVLALDEVVALLLKRGELGRARARIDERLGLADAVEPRLVRVHLEIRLRQWAAAQEDFRCLKMRAPADPVLKEALPAWERVERALGEVQAADASVDAVPRGTRERLERALVCTRLGLWQNAADDLRQVADAAPSARMPGLLGEVLGLPETFTRQRTANDADPVAQLPWLASTKTLSGFSDRFEGKWAQWRALAALEARLLACQDEEGVPGERAAAGAEHARLLCELSFPAQALAEATVLLKARPGFRPACRVAILALLASGEIAQAASQVEQVLVAQGEAPVEPDREFQRLAGLVRQAQGRHAAAVEALTACLDGDTPRPDLLRARARSLRQLQRFSEAAQDVAAAERLESSGETEGAK
jgi:hypothetical protein